MGLRRKDGAGRTKVGRRCCYCTKLHGAACIWGVVHDQGPFEWYDALGAAFDEKGVSKVVLLTNEAKRSGHVLYYYVAIFQSHEMAS